MIIAEHGKPRCRILLGTRPAWLERHAAEELQRYLARMANALIPVEEEPVVSGPVLAIGRPERNPFVARAIASGAVGAPPSEESDGFVIQTVEIDDAESLVIAGSSDRGTLYGVYWLLEEVLGVGFFRDGERVPNLTTVELPPLSISERPHFPERHEGNGCVFTYSASSWGVDEWKRELDWKSKRRFNTTWPFDVAHDLLPRMLADWGVDTQVPSRSEGHTVHEQAFRYARSLGIRIPCIIGNLPATPELRARFPETRVLVLQYSELPPYTIVHPGDPLFRRYVVEYVRRYNDSWGSDHLYIASFISESKVLEGAANLHEARLDFARAVSEALKEADPKATWIIETWSFDMDAEDVNHRWSPAQIKEYLGTVSVPHIVADLWSEERGKYLQTENFFGHPWGFGVLHSFGAGSYLHGDVSLLLKKVRDVVNQPDGKNCRMFLLQPEIIQFNSFFYEFCAQVAWDPLRGNVESFVERYCRKRYGASLGEKLREPWNILVDTVYGSESGSVGTITDPLYWYRPDLHLLLGWTKPDDKTATLRARRHLLIPKLRDVLELFLAQEVEVRADPLALRDFVDVARQWIAERFNIAIISARDAFLAGDEVELEKRRAECVALLDDQTRLLSSWPPYRLDTKVNEHRARFGDDAERWVKHTHVWVYGDEGMHSPPLRDYYRMDLDGLIADYYRPRVTAYFDLLHSKLNSGNQCITPEELDSAYQPIEEAFVSQTMRRLPAEEDPLAIVRGLLAGQ